MSFGIIIGISVGLGVLVVVIIYYFMFKEERAEKKNTKLEQRGETRVDKVKPIKTNPKRIDHSPLDVEQLFGIECIKNNVVYEKNGRIDVIIRYSTPEFFAISEVDQEIYEDALIRFCVSSSYNFKIIEVVNSTDMSLMVNNIRENINENREIYSTKTIEYAKLLANQLKSKEFDVGESIIQKYIVLGSKDRDEDVAMKELKQITEEILSSILSTGIEITLLETGEIIELFNRLINHRSRISVNDYTNKGVFEEYSVRGDYYEE
jgi:hypothetical protein